MDRVPNPSRTLDEANAEIEQLHERIARLERDLAAARRESSGDGAPVPSPHTGPPHGTPDTPLLDVKGSPLASLEQFAEQIEAVRSFWKETARGGSAIRMTTGLPQASVDGSDSSDEAANRKLDDLRSQIQRLREERAQASRELLQIARTPPEQLAEAALGTGTKETTGTSPSLEEVVAAAERRLDPHPRASPMPPVTADADVAMVEPLTEEPFDETAPALRIVPDPSPAPSVVQGDRDTLPVSLPTADVPPVAEEDPAKTTAEPVAAAAATADQAHQRVIAEVEALLASAEEAVEKVRQGEREPEAGPPVEVEREPDTVESAVETEAPSPARRSRAPLIAAALAVVVGGGAWWWSSQSSPVTTPTTPPAPQRPAPATAAPAVVPPDLPPQTSPEPTSVAAEPPASEAAATPAQVPAGVHRVRLTIVRDVWLDVLADGARAQRGIFTAGEALDVDVKGNLQIRAGDAGAVRVDVDGETRGPLGADGAVTTRTFEFAGPPR